MRRSPAPLWLLLPCLLAGCSLLFAPAPNRTRSFVLTPISTEAPRADNPLSLSVQPARLPAYLERAEMVTRVAANELRPAASDRWAEPLDEGFTRVLGQNLGTLLHTDRVVTTMWYGKQRPVFIVSVSVERFEASADGTATLIARWAVQRGSDDSVVAALESRYTHAVEAHTTAAAVDALSACLAELSGAIGTAIREAEKKSNE